jgi:hypothetical protein
MNTLLETQKSELSAHQKDIDATVSDNVSDGDVDGIPMKGMTTLRYFVNGRGP